MRISDWSSDVCSSDLATFSVGAGATVPFILAWRPSHRPVERSIDPQRRLQETESWWLGWSGRCQFGGGGPDHWRDAVTRSLITLKALTFAPTGGIVAAATTSLPEQIGGERNWDYRYCWIRDATLRSEEHTSELPSLMRSSDAA